MDATAPAMSALFIPQVGGRHQRCSHRNKDHLRQTEQRIPIDERVRRQGDIPFEARLLLKKVFGLPTSLMKLK